MTVAQLVVLMVVMTGFHWEKWMGLWMAYLMVSRKEIMSVSMMDLLTVSL